MIMTAFASLALNYPRVFKSSSKFLSLRMMKIIGIALSGPIKARGPCLNSPAGKASA